MECRNETYRITEEELERFLIEQRARGRPEKKLIRMRRHLCTIYNHLPEHQLLTRKALEHWRQTLLDSGLSVRTLETYVTDVNALLKWAGHKELCFRQGKPADLTRRRFGRLVAIEPLPEREGGGHSILWRCRCDCGREIKAPANQLLRGSYKSCGCMRTEQLMDSNLYVDHTCLKKVLSGTVRKDNTSGCTGVFRKRDKWAARIQYKGKIYSLGCYERLEDAVRARKKAENWVKDDAERLLALLNAPEQAG